MHTDGCFLQYERPLAVRSERIALHWVGDLAAVVWIAHAMKRRFAREGVSFSWAQHDQGAGWTQHMEQALKICRRAEARFGFDAVASRFQQISPAETHDAELDVRLLITAMRQAELLKKISRKRVLDAALAEIQGPLAIKVPGRDWCQELRSVETSTPRLTPAD